MVRMKREGKETPESVQAESGGRWRMATIEANATVAQTCLARPSPVIMLSCYHVMHVMGVMGVLVNFISSEFLLEKCSRKTGWERILAGDQWVGWFIGAVHVVS